MLDLTNAEVGSAWRTASGKKSVLEYGVTSMGFGVMHNGIAGIVMHKSNGELAFCRDSFVGCDLVARWPSAEDIPDGYEDAGEFRVPKIGEAWLRYGWELAKQSAATFGGNDSPEKSVDGGKRHLLRKKKIIGVTEHMRTSEAEVKPLAGGDLEGDTLRQDIERIKHKLIQEQNCLPTSEVTEGDRLLEFFKDRRPIAEPWGTSDCTTREPEPVREPCACCLGTGAMWEARPTVCGLSCRCPECNGSGKHG